jgi:uncharacterized protein YehS (DUF1456 family)
MTNNEALQHIRYIFSLDSDRISSIFQQAECVQTAEQIENYLRKNGESEFARVQDNTLASFLDGLIIELRGKKEGTQAQLNQEVNNNVVFNKIKIALALKADDIITLLAAGELTLSKHELSAFFRKPEHKHYRPCHDETLVKFLNGLHLQYQQEIKDIKE